MSEWKEDFIEVVSSAWEPYLEDLTKSEIDKLICSIEYLAVGLNISANRLSTFIVTEIEKEATDDASN